MWDKVESRRHRLGKIFFSTFDETTDGEVAEFMLYGTVTYRLKAGSEATADWAGHARLARKGATDPWKFVSYRVYIQR